MSNTVTIPAEMLAAFVDWINSGSDLEYWLERTEDCVDFREPARAEALQVADYLTQAVDALAG